MKKASQAMFFMAILCLTVTILRVFNVVLLSPVVFLLCILLFVLFCFLAEFFKLCVSLNTGKIQAITATKNAIYLVLILILITLTYYI